MVSTWRLMITSVSRTWILQANPKLYDIDAAIKAKQVIYWRVPQYTDDVKAGDRALMWRAGKQSGLIGWGVFLTDPKQYDLSAEADDFWKTATHDQPHENYAPLRVWPAGELPKADVAAVIPAHRVVTAPMGTVFALGPDDLTALAPLLATAGYDLSRAPEPGFVPLPAYPGAAPVPKLPALAKPGPRITPALFLLPSSPERPIEITIEGDALRLALAEREALKALDDTWDATGVYFLVGKPQSSVAALSVYVGKAQGLRSRVTTGHNQKDWTRCLLIQRPGLHPFNASDIAWLERRLIDVLLEAPEVDLVNKTPPPPEVVPSYKAEILERTVVAALGVLAVLGAYVA
jgi:hypothetical protein